MNSALKPSEAGRRLYAAILSCHRNEHLAEIYEFDTPAQVDPFWEEMAQTLAHALGRKLDHQPIKKTAGTTVTKGLVLAWPKPDENTGPEF